MAHGETKFGLNASDTAVDDEVTIEKLKQNWNILNQFQIKVFQTTFSANVSPLDIGKPVFQGVFSLNTSY